MTHEPAPGLSPDARELMAEIDAEVRARRAAGDIPAGFERELDALFARFSPSGTGDDFTTVLDRAEHDAFIDADPPLGSAKRGGLVVKKGVRAAVGWYLQYVTQQVATFGTMTVRAVRILGERVERLEAASGSAAVAAEAAKLAPSTPVAPFTPQIVARVTGAPGRVLHADAGTGELLVALADAGIDAYGVEPRDVALVPPADARLEIRADDVVGHLRAIADATLGAVVLSGVVDIAPVGELLELAQLVAAKVAPGGAMVVVSADPRSWGRGRSSVESDLAPGRPLHAETWVRLLSERGFRDVVVEDAPGPHVGGNDQPTHELDARVERLEAELFGREAYLVAGVRDRAS
ncbi:MAG: hypothetical protein JWL73_3570 [Actinomycetia bacterium]|nr:hypothetical protein [Actinomycetes bacterium]